MTGEFLALRRRDVRSDAAVTEGVPRGFHSDGVSLAPEAYTD